MNERHDKILNQVQEAKWVLRFPKGNPTINVAWKKLVELVENNVLWDIKASAKNDEYENQIICVYIADAKNLTEIIAVYDVLVKNGLLKLHMEQDSNEGLIKYITDESTRLHNCEHAYTNKDIEDLHKLFELRETVSKEMFTKRWDEFIETLECSMAKKALPEGFKRTYFSVEESKNRLKLLEKINKFQLANDTQSVAELNEVIKKIRSTLTSNYKFTTVELLTNAISLIEAIYPHQALTTKLFKSSMPLKSFASSIFHHHPTIGKFTKSVELFEKLVEDEKIRLSKESKSIAQNQ